MRGFISSLILLSCFVGFTQDVEEKLSDTISDQFYLERVPIYPGCNKRDENKALQKCMQDKMSRHISKKFNTDVVTNLDLSGKQRILAVFKIDTTGNITNIKIRAPHPVLAKEAERVLNLVPTMWAPGYSKGKPVTVPYSIPMYVTIYEDTKLTRKEKRRRRREENLKKIKQKQ